jgi:hypothetical protein
VKSIEIQIEYSLCKYRYFTGERRNSQRRDKGSGLNGANGETTPWARSNICGVVIMTITALSGVLRSDQVQTRATEQKLQLGVGWCAAAG